MVWVELLNNLDLSIIAQNGLKVTSLTPVKQTGFIAYSYFVIM